MIVSHQRDVLGTRMDNEQIKNAVKKGILRSGEEMKERCGILEENYKDFFK